MKIKMCGITTPADVAAVNEVRPDYIGMVMYFPKSKRNVSVETASGLLEDLIGDVQRVAVVVEPEAEQISEISILYSMNCPMKLLQALSNKDIDIRTLQLFNNILSKETRRDINKLLSIANDNANKIYPKYIRYAILKDLKDINKFLEL